MAGFWSGTLDFYPNFYSFVIVRRQFFFYTVTSSLFLKHKYMDELLQNKRKGQAGPVGGFTLIELLVTLAILSMFYGLILVNFASWRGPQYVRVSANELSTNISKLRSYALSARNLNGKPAQMYVLKLNTATPTTYAVQGVETTDGGEVFREAIETIRLPGGAAIQSLSLTTKTGVTSTPACVQIAFSLPFGRAYLNPSCDFNVAKTPGALDALSDGRLTIVLGKSGVSLTKTIIMDAISGQAYVQ